MGLQTEWFRIGKSGPTVDGRVIKEEWLDDAAKTYNPNDKFTARIWPDHNRYVNYGKVLAVRVEGNSEGGKDLYAKLEPNAYYQSDVRYGQKVHFSIEITPDFAKTGKAYLTGLGATDDPASLGTGEAKFTQYADQAGVFKADFVEGKSKQFDDPQQDSLFNQLKALFTSQSKEDSDMADKQEMDKLKQEFSDLKTLLLEKFGKLDGGKGDEKGVDDKTEISALKHEFADLKALLLEKFGNQDGGEANKDKKADGNENPFEMFTNSLLEAIESKFGKQDARKDEEKSELKAMQDQLAAFNKKLEDALKEQPGTEGGQHFGNGDDAKNYI